MTAALAESALSFLSEPAKTLISVEEEFEDHGTEIERTVCAKLALIDDETIFIAQKPKKGVLVYVHAERAQGPISVERLSHSEHKHVEQWLVLYRFWSWWQTIDAMPHHIDEVALLNPVLMNRLLVIPFQEQADAHKAILEVFGVSVIGDIAVQNAGGSLMRRLRYGKDAKNDSPLVTFDNIQYENLVRLCIELASRYYVAFRLVQTDEQHSGAVHFVYQYRQHYRIRWGGFLGRARSRHGGAPPAIRVHAPLARMTDHYSISMPANEGYYFSAQNILLEDSGRSVSTTKDYGSPNSKHGTLKVANNFWREVAGGSIAHLHLDSGTKLASKVFIGLELAERPPGSEGRAYDIVRVTLFATLLLCVWKYTNPAGAPIAALMASLLTIGGLAVQSYSVEIPLFEAPAVPRWIIAIQAYLSIIFAVWLLTVPPMEYQFPSNWNRFCGVWATCGGAAIVLALLVLCATARVRLARAQRYYEHAVLNRKHDTAVVGRRFRKKLAN